MPERFGFSREAAKITLDKIESWEELNAATVQEADERFRQATLTHWKEFAVSGVLQYDLKEKKQVLRPFTDLDGRVAVGLLAYAGIQIGKLTFVKPGSDLKGFINLDTGGAFGVSYDPSTYTAYFDHHAPAAEETSTAEILYKTFVDLGLIKASKTLDRLVKFVTDIDNRRLPPEEFMRSGKTILGLQRDLSFEKLLAYFKDHASPTELLEEKELEKYGLQKAAREQQTLVDESLRSLSRMEKENKVFSTNYGQILLNVNNELKAGSSAAYVRFDGIINMTPGRSFAVTLKDRDLNGAAIKNHLGNRFQGKIIRRRMWIYNEEDPLTLTTEDIVAALRENNQNAEDDSPIDDRFRLFFEEKDGEMVNQAYASSQPVEYSISPTLIKNAVFIPPMIVSSSAAEIRQSLEPRLAAIYWDDRGKDAMERFGDDEAISADFYAGLERYHVFFHRGRALYVFDNHHHALFAWREAKDAGILKGKVALIRLDAHTDMDKPWCETDTSSRTGIRDAIAHDRLDIKNFTVPALHDGLIDRMYFYGGSPLINLLEQVSDPRLQIQVRNPEFESISHYRDRFEDITDAGLANPDSIRELMEGLAAKDFQIILDIDFDVFEDREEDTKEVKKQKERLRKLLPELAMHARVITCATSPHYANQEKAVKWVKDFVADVISQ